MNHYLLVLTCLLSNDLCGMQKVSHSETLIPGGKSAITSYLHILPRDVEESIAQLLLRAYPALFRRLHVSFRGILRRYGQ